MCAACVHVCLPSEASLKQSGSSNELRLNQLMPYLCPKCHGIHKINCSHILEVANISVSAQYAHTFWHPYRQ